MHYLGIDVAKAKLDCALLDPLTDKRKTKSVTNDSKGFTLLADWLDKHGVALTEVHAVLEATGVYHEAVALWRPTRVSRCRLPTPPRSKTSRAVSPCAPRPTV